MRKWFISLGIVGALLVALLLVFQPLQYFYSVPSDSMVPTYELGSRTFTNPYETPKEGDVVEFICLSKSKCFDRYNLPVIHRWVSTDKDGCMTIIGDNPKYDWERWSCFYPNEIKVVGVNRAFF